MKDVYIVEYLVKDCLGADIAENYLNMHNTPGATDIIRYNTQDFPNVLCKRAFQMHYENNDYSAFKMATDLTNAVGQKYLDTGILPKDTAVIFGSFAVGSRIRDEFIHTFESGASRYSPTRLFQGNHDLLSALVAGKLKLEGINTSLNGACSSSMFNLHFGTMLIQTGQCSMALVGAVDMPVHEKLQFYWQSTSAISTLAGGNCQPFDKKRDGFVQGEGGTIWVICDEESLIKHNLTPVAKIRSIVSGAKVTSMTAHDKTCENQIKLIDQALSLGNVRKEEIAFFNAHATSTLVGDDIEIDVFQKAFDGYDLPIVSFKGHIGHTMSACGLIESAYGLEAVRQGWIQPNFNLTDPLSDDPRIIVDRKQLRSKIFLKASFGFGGRTSIAIFESL